MHGCVESTGIRDVKYGFVGRKGNAIGHMEVFFKKLCQGPGSYIEGVLIHIPVAFGGGSERSSSTNIGSHIRMRRMGKPTLSDYY
jgi:hypothetical protein